MVPCGCVIYVTRNVTTMESVGREWSSAPVPCQGPCRLCSEDAARGTGCHPGRRSSSSKRSKRAVIAPVDFFSTTLSPSSTARTRRRLRRRLRRDSPARSSLVLKETGTDKNPDSTPHGNHIRFICHVRFSRRCCPRRPSIVHPRSAYSSIRPRCWPLPCPALSYPASFESSSLTSLKGVAATQGACVRQYSVKAGDTCNSIGAAQGASTYV